MVKYSMTYKAWWKELESLAKIIKFDYEFLIKLKKGTLEVDCKYNSTEENVIFVFFGNWFWFIVNRFVVRSVRRPNGTLIFSGAIERD